MPAALLADTHTWTGGAGGGNYLATTPENWGGTAPEANDDIVLAATSHSNMTWNMTNMVVASWTQVGYLGTVTVETVYGTGFTNLNITGDCIISNGVWTHVSNSGGETNRLMVSIGGSLIVGTNAAIDVTAKGYAAHKGPGGADGTVGLTQGGGSYGGRGGSGSPTPSGPCYGSIVAPTNLGSGGESFAGGGAILLTVSGVIRNDGLLCADGGGPYNYLTGSGGSIYLIAGALIGSGTIQVNGGRATSNRAGGGGRVALVVTNADADFSSFTGTIFACSGRAGAGAGTVYLRTAAQGLYEGALIVDNNNFISDTYTTEIDSLVTDAVVGDVLIRNNGFLRLCTNQSLTVSGIWSNGASFSAQFDSQVIFAGAAASTSTVYGSNTFMGLTCTNAGGKTLVFEAGKTNTVAARGRLTLRGSETETNLILRSTSDATAWKLNVDALADQSIWHVDVTNSDARPGVSAVAMGSLDRGGNMNWVFKQVAYGETNTWTGGSNTSWSFSANWDLERPPQESDFIVIPALRPRYPVLDNHRTVNGIEIQTNASLSLAGYNLTVTTNALVAGALTASGMETITFQGNVTISGRLTAGAGTIVFQGNVDFSGGSFVPAVSTVVLAGSGAQTVNPANLTFYRVNVLNSAGLVAFGGGFSATELRCEAAGGTRNIAFQQGATFALRDLVLLGSTASTNIFLRSSVSGQKWNLAVSGYRSVRGVDVKDGDASLGLPIPAASSKDSGNNPNWFFNATQSVWLGTSGTNFHTAANWLSGLVPDATARVLVESANPMSITGAVTILDLTVGGGAGLATVTAYASLTVVENITVASNGALALNRPCVISNGLYVLAGGLLTHSANTTSEVNKMEATVHGNMGVDVNAAVNVAGKGYAAQQGPGGAKNPMGGGSHGERGGSSTLPSGPCYGSIVAPTNLGSGGESTAGGGAILLTVSGVIRNDGLICADGHGGVIYNYLTGSGGSIYLIAGALTGIGAIQANGGSFTQNRGGGGGRVALVMTDGAAMVSPYSGTIQARSSRLTFAGISLGGLGAGTIYRQRPSDPPGRGSVLVDNNGSLSGGYTDVPPGPPNVSNEVNFVSFHISNSATLRLTNDFIIGDLYVQSANAWLDLGSNTLTVRSRAHLLGPGVVTNFGAIVWWPDIPKGVVFSTW